MNGIDTNNSEVPLLISATVDSVKYYGKMPHYANDGQTAARDSIK